MAKCPDCSYRLKIWDIKAECPSCKVNIPNFNWEERLKEDAIRSEKAFGLLRERVKNAKAFLFGSRLRLIRFLLTFSPLILLIIPFMSATVNLPYINEKADISVLSAVLWIVGNSLDFGSVISLLSSDIIGEAILLTVLGTAFFLLAFILAVLSFFLLVIRSVSLDNRGNIVCNILSLAFSAVSLVLFPVSFEKLISTGINFLQEPAAGAALFAAIVLYAVNLTLNILTEKDIRADRKAFREHRKTIGKLS